jgi:hypothetical protein
MLKTTTINAPGQRLMYSERWEVDHLCNRFGLSRAMARIIFQRHSGDRARMEQEAEYLATGARIGRFCPSDREYSREEAHAQNLF